MTRRFLAPALKCVFLRDRTPVLLSGNPDCARLPPIVVAAKSECFHKVVVGRGRWIGQEEE